ncbi:MAG TPA: hypothetical protein V6D47_19095 [Oscillatoriaceae cyanobacterium]
MKSKRNLQTMILVATLAMGLSLTGCGRRAANMAAPDASSGGDTSASTTAPIDNTPVDNTPVDNTPTVPTTGTTPYAAPTVGSLAVTNVAKKTHGVLMFKKLEVTGEVINTSNAPLSGTLKITFEKSSGIFNKTLSESETKTQDFSNIQPGQSESFDITSSNSAADAEVTVDTLQTQAPLAAQSYGYGATTGGYGATTGGYGATAGGYGTTTTQGYPAPTAAGPYGY